VRRPGASSVGWSRWSVLVLLIALSGSAPARAQEHEAVDEVPLPQALTLTGRVDDAIDSLIDELDFDPQRARDWVHDAVKAEAYDGVLKGARGAFLTRAGNDVDRALLLGAILDRAAVPHRYAACSLPSAAPSAAERTVPATTRLVDHAEKIAGAVSDPGLRAAIRTVQRLRNQERATTTGSAHVLASALARIGYLPPTPPRAEVSMRRHIWVQAAWGAGWRDLDTLSATGQAPCSPDTVDTDMAAEPHYLLRLMLEVERRVGSTLVISEALTQEYTTAEIATSHIAFGFSEAAGIGDGIVQGLQGRASYTPALDVDGQVELGLPLVLLTPTAGEPDPFGPADDWLPGDVGESTSAWLRFQLLAPDESVTNLSSVVFDRIGAAARAAGTADTAPLRPMQVVDGEYSEMATLWQVGVLLGEIDPSLFLGASGSDLTTNQGLLDHLDTYLRLFPAVYHDMGGTGTGPTILLAGVSTVPTTDGSGMAWLALDALHVPGLVQRDAAAAALDAEAVLGAESFLISLVAEGPAGSDGARAVFHAAETEMVPLTILRPGAAIDIPGIDEDARARMSLRLTQGLSLLVPARAVLIEGASVSAWWVIDPATGSVRDETQDGRHAPAGESVPLWKRAHKWAQTYCPVGLKIAKATMLSAALLGVGSGVHVPPTEFLRGVGESLEVREKTRKLVEEAATTACQGVGA